MKKPVSSELLSEPQHAAGRAIDEAVHTQLSKWALYLAAVPGRQMLLAQHTAFQPHNPQYRTLEQASNPV